MRAAERLIPDELAQLHVDVARQALLAALIQAKERFGDAVIEARTQGRPQVSAELSIMERIRSAVGDMQRNARKRMAIKNRRESARLLALGTLAGVALPLSFFWVFASALLRRQRERKAVDRLRLSEERHRNLIESSASIIWTTDSDGAFRGDQPSWTGFTGQAPERLRDYGWLEAVYPDDRATALDGWKEAVAHNRLYFAEMRLRRADGEWRDMGMRAVPLLSYGEARKWVGTHTDVTALLYQMEDLIVVTGANGVVRLGNSDALQALSGPMVVTVSGSKDALQLNSDHYNLVANGDGSSIALNNDGSALVVNGRKLCWKADNSRTLFSLAA